MHLLKNASWFPLPTMSFHSTPFLPSPAGDSWGDSTIKLPSKRQVYPAYKYMPPARWYGFPCPTPFAQENRTLFLVNFMRSEPGITLSTFE